MRRSTALGFVVAVGTSLGVAGPVQAERPDSSTSTVSIGPLASGGVVSQGTAGYGSTGTEAAAGSQREQPSPPQESAGAPGGAGDYTYRPLPNNQTVAAPVVVSSSGVITIPPAATQNACPPGQTGYLVYGPGGNGSYGAICAAQAAPASTTSSENQLAEEASSKQPWPNLVVGINPGTGLAGLASWFWLGGGSPQMPDATASSGPLSVKVHAALVRVEWQFGDGSFYDSSGLGQPYPARSEIQHVYQTDTYGKSDGYLVSGLLRFQVTYSVNDGPWQPLGVKTKAYSRPYPVYQIQPQAVSGQ